MKNQSTRTDTPANGSRLSDTGSISDETSTTSSKAERASSSSSSSSSSPTSAATAANTFAHDLADKFEDFLAGTRFKRTYDQIESFANARPMLAVAIGVLAGAVFGRRIIRLIF